MIAFPNPVAGWLSRGENCLTHGDSAQALLAFEQALSLAQQSCHPQAELWALQRLGQAHLEQGQLALAVALFDQAIAIAVAQHNLQALYACHRQLAATHKALNHFELALHHLEAAEELRDQCGAPSPPANSGVEAGAAPLLTRHNPIAQAAPPAVQGPTQDAAPLPFRTIVERANLGIALFQQGHLVYGNPRLRQWVGYDDSELWQLTSSDLLTFASELGGDAFELAATAPVAGQLHGKAGEVIEVEIYAAPVDDGDRQRPGRSQFLVIFLRDITEAQRLEDQLKASEARYRSLIHHVPIGLCRFSVEGRPLDANPALLAIFGCDTLPNFLQASPIQPDSPVTDQGQPMAWSSYLGMTNLLKDCELKLSRLDGRDLWVRIVARAIADSHGTIQYYEGAVEDITEIKAAQTALEELAMRDSLTHVYNRRHFMELASREIARSARFNRPVTLLMLDIDHFKAINDTYGHLAGDTVLRDIALRLRANLRQSDILARYGGEEFILLMPETDQAQAWTGAERLRTIIAATPFDSGSGPLLVTASVGLSCWPGSPDPNVITSLPHINNLISKADQALYRAKQSGRNQTQAEAWLYTASSQIA